MRAFDLEGLEPRLMLSADAAAALGAVQVEQGTQPIAAITIVDTLTQPIAAQSAPAAGGDIFNDVADEALAPARVPAAATTTPIAPAAPAAAATSTVETAPTAAVESAPAVASAATIAAAESSPANLAATAVSGQSSTLSDQLTTTLKGANGPPADAQLASGQQNGQSAFYYVSTDTIARVRSSYLVSGDSGSNTPRRADLSATYSADHNFGADGTTTINISGSGSGQFDTVSVTGNATLGGTLAITVANTATLQVGDSLTIITASTGVSGTFTTATGLVGFGDGSRYFTIVQDASSVKLVVTQFPGPGFSFLPDTTASATALGRFLNSTYFPSDTTATVTGGFGFGQGLSARGTFAFDRTTFSAVDIATGLTKPLSQYSDTEITPDVKTQLTALGISADGTSINNVGMSAIRVSATGAEGFIGENGINLTTSFSGQFESGFVLKNMSLGVVIMTPTWSVGSALPRMSFAAGKANSSSISASGLTGLMDFSAQGATIQFNRGSSFAPILQPAVVDIAKSFETTSGAANGTYTVGGMQLDFAGQPKLEASLTGVSISLLDVLDLRGDFLFSIDAQRTVTVQNNVPANLTAVSGYYDTAIKPFVDAGLTVVGNNTGFSGLVVNSYRLSATNVSGFMGLGDAAFDATSHAITNGSDLTGFGFTNLNIDIGLFTPASSAIRNLGMPDFMALKGSVASAATYGLDGILQMNAQDITLAINKSVRLKGFDIPNVPNFTLPTIQLPKLLMPDLTLPSISLPQLGLPSINLPDFNLTGFSLPSITLPNLQIPSITLPSITLPTIDLSNIIPTITLPSLTLPAITLPDLQLPTIDLSALKAYLPNPSLPSLTLPTLALPDLALPPIHFPDLIPTLDLSLSVPRIVFPTITLPTIQLPSINLPDLDLSAFGLPKLHLPALTLPSITLPSFTLPAINLPNLNITAPDFLNWKLLHPDLHLPTLKLPDLDLPAFHLPQLTLPNLDLSAFKLFDLVFPTLPGITLPNLTLPNLTLPTLSFPSLQFPSIDLSGLGLPSLSVPSFSLPNFSLPQVTLPSLQLPKLYVPEFDLTKLKLPKISLPTLTLPTISLPTLTLPSFNITFPQMPTIQLPDLHLPSISLPSLTLPSIDLPDINLAGLSLPGLPKITLPSINLPSLSLPSIQLPDLHLPAIKLPDVNVPSLASLAGISLTKNGSPVIDFKTTFGTGGLNLGNSALDFDGNPRTTVIVNQVDMQVASALSLSGSVAFEMGPRVLVNVATGLPANLGAAASLVQPLFNDLANNVGLTIGSNFSTISGLEVETMTVGASNLSGFLGYGSPNLHQSLSSQDVTGFGFSNVNFGLAIFKPTLPIKSLPKFTTLKATASSFSTYGLDDIAKISGTGISIEVNTGTKWPANLGTPTIDFTTSFPANGGNPVGFAVRMPTGNPTMLDYAGGQRIALGIQSATITLSDFVMLSGGIRVEMGATYIVDVATGLPANIGSALGAFGLDSLANQLTSTAGITVGPNFSTIEGLEVGAMTIGGTNISAWVGSSSYDFSQPLASQDVFGLKLDNLSFGLGIFKPTIPINALPKFTAFTAHADSFQFKGGNSNILSLGGRDITINVNTGTEWPGGIGTPVINFKSSFETAPGANNGQFAINTALGTPIYLGFDGNPRIGATIAKATAQISQFVYLVGSFSFEKGPTLDASLIAGVAGSISNLVPAEFGGTGNKQLSTITIGGTGISAFVGLNGPYWVDANNDGVINRDSGGNILSAETNSRATGLVVDNVTFGVLYAKPTNPLDPVRYLGVKADATTVKLVGISGVTAAANGIHIAVNISTPTASIFPVLPVINFAGLAGGKYSIKTGAKDSGGNDITVDLNMNSALIHADGFLALNVFGIVYLTGSVSFDLGPTKSVTLANNSTKTVTTMSIGVAHVNAFIGANGPYWTDSNGNKQIDSGELSSTAAGFSVADFTGGLLVMASTNPSDLGAYVSLKATIPTFGLVNIPGGLSATGTLDVVLNLGVGLSGIDPNVSPVNLSASFTEVPALFTLMDTNGDKKLDQSEQNAALVPLKQGGVGYIGQDITSAAQLASVLNATGTSTPQDAYLTMAEVRARLTTTFKTAHQAAIDGLDVDGNGRLNTGYEVGTGDPTSPVILDADSFLIDVQLGGQLSVSGVFRLTGIALFNVDSSGLKAFVAGAFQVGPDIGLSGSSAIFTMNALGALVMSHAGVAADIQVSATLGGPLASYLSLNATARFLFNTTSATQTITIPQRYAVYITGPQSAVAGLPGSASFNPASAAPLAGTLTNPGTTTNRFTTNSDGSLTFTIDAGAPKLGGGSDPAGPYFLTAFHGSLSILRTFTITGDFQLKVSGSSLQLAYNGSLNMGGFASTNIIGAAVIEGGVFAAYARLSIDINLAGGVHITGGADFQINTGSAAKTVYDALGAGHSITPTTYMVSVNATIDLFGVLSATGTVSIGIQSGNFQITFAGSLSFFGIANISISGNFNTNGTFSFTGSLGLDLTAGSGLSEFGIKGGLSITLNNSGVSGTGSVSLVVLGTSIPVASGTVSVNWSTGAWKIRAEGPLSVWLEVTSDGHGGWSIDGGLGFFDNVLGALKDVANTIADGTVAAVNAVANAAIALGGAIVQFGQSVATFFSDVGNAIADAAGAVWDAISGYFESNRTVVTQYTPDPKAYYQYSWSLNNGTLTITNGTGYGHASNLNVWEVDGNLVIDAPDYTQSVLVATSQHQHRDYYDDGWPPWGEWGDWYNDAPAQNQYANINVTNATAIPLWLGISKIVINGTDYSETIVEDRNTVSINTDVYGNGGDDVIATGKGDDHVYGGEGNDTIFTYEGNDYIDGGNGNDRLYGGGGNNQIYGGAGDDVLDVNNGRSDPGTLTSETNILDGGSGNDTILGSPGVDTVTGGSGNDTLLGLANDDTYVFVDGYGTDKFVDYNGKVTLDFTGAASALTIPIDSTGLTANAGGNSLHVDNLTWIDQLKLGAGNDQVTVTAPPSHLLTISDAGGRDSLTYDDTATTANSTGVLTSNRLTGLGMGNADHTVVDSNYGIAYFNIEDVTVSLGSGNNTFTVTSTPSGTSNTTTVNAGTGPDTVNVTDASDTLTVNGQSGADTFNINGTGASSVVAVNGGDGNDSFNVNGTSGTLTVSGGNDSDIFNVNGTGASGTTTLNGDGSDDIFNVKAINGVTTANGGSGADTFNVGSKAAGVVGDASNNTGGTLNSIAALLTIGDASGTDILNVDDTGDSAANNGTLTNSRLTGLGMGDSTKGISYSAIETLNISLGGGGNTLNVQSTNTATLTNVYSGAGSDTINLGSLSPATGGNVNAITGKLVVNGQGGADTINVDDTGDSTDNSGTLTDTRLTGLGMGADTNGLQYSNVESLIINLGTGADTFNVQSTNAGTVATVNTGTGSATNVVNVGSLAPATGGNVNSIAGSLVVVGQSLSDTLNVDDRGDTATNNGTLTSSRLTGLGMAGDDGSKGITYTTIETLNISLGSGADNFTIQTTHSGVTVLNTLGGNDHVAINATSGNTTVNGGDGDDTINVGSAATVTANTGGTLNAILGALTVNGEAGAGNVLNLDDTADNLANTGTITSTTVTGLGLGASGITYSGLTALNLNLGSAGDTLTIASTHAALTHVEGRDGNDQFFVQNISGRTEIQGQNGSDTVTVTNTVSGAQTVNGIQALLVVDGGSDAGTDALVVSELNEAAGLSQPGTLTSTLLSGLGMAATGGVNYTTFETIDITLGSGDDNFYIASTHTGSTTLKAGAGNDQVNIATLSGPTVVNGQAGDDTIKVNVDNAGAERVIGGSTVNGVGALLTLDGNDGADHFVIYLAGAPFSPTYAVSTVTVHDSGDPLSGTNFLEIYGTDKASVSDNFLIRTSFIALLPPPANGGPATAERINYDGTLTAGVAIYGRAGNDYFAFDDNSAPMTVDGGDGNDIFQIGQMFQSERVPGNVASSDAVPTVHTTQGYLTPGVRFATTVYGGDGDDQFIIFSNQGPLGLFGEDGNDSFTVRAFALYDSGAVDPNRANTNVNAGGGADYVEYNINAPVAIDGGDGLDKIVVVGTEFSDHFVITADGVYGAGQFVTFTGIELLEVDGAEGDDSFVVLGTPAGVVTHIYGGLGNDTISVGGQAGAVVSRDLQGHSGIIDNLVVSSDVAWSDVPAPGVSVDVADNDAPGVVITQSGGATTVAEKDYGIGLNVDSYTVVLSAAPTSDVYITVSAPVLSLREQAAGAKSVLVYTDAPNSPPKYQSPVSALELHFTPANWNQPQTVYVKGLDDTAAEGTRYVLIQHSISTGSAPGYAGLALPNVTVKIIDDDVASVQLIPIAGATANSTRLGTTNPILEGSTALSSQSFILLLTKAPNAGENVTVSVSGDQFDVSGTSTFTFGAGGLDPAVAQVVTVRAVDDGIVEGPHRGTVNATIASTGGAYTGAAAATYEQQIADANSPGVILLQSDGSTRTIEGGTAASAAPWNDTYSLALTQAPADGQTVSLRILAAPTPTTNNQLLALEGNPDVASYLSTIVPQVTVSSTAPGAAYQTIDGKTYLVLTFDASNWSTPQVVNVGAIDDTTVDGGDIQAFAPSLQTVDGVRGPLIIDGGADPSTDRGIPNPLMFLGESNPQQHVAKPNPNLNVVEANAIDTLTVYNNDAVARQSGTLTSSRITGLGMGSDLTLDGQNFGGGITYGDFENLSIYLGKGADTFEVQSTHAGETLIDAGKGDDVVNLRTVLGHTTVRGGEGNDQITLGTPNASELTIDQLRALVTIDGGTGADTVSVDDRADTNNNVGTLDNTTLTGLDLLEARIRTLTITNALSGDFTITIDGHATGAVGYTATSAQVRAALVGLNLPGVKDVTVNRAGNTFTIGFLADESVASNALAMTINGGGLIPARDSNGSVLAVQATVTASVLNRVQTIALPAAAGTFNVTMGTGPSFAITAGDTADTVRLKILDALNPGFSTGHGMLSTDPSGHGYGFKDVLVSQFGTNYEVVFQGLLSGSRGAAYTFSVAPRSTASATSFTLDAIGGTFRLNFTGSTLQTMPLAWNASAADVQAALRGILGSSTLTVAQAGSTYTVNFAGSPATFASVDDRNLVAPITVADRSSGIDYYGIDTLNVNLGHGGDVFNVRGTTAVTNLFTNAGDDRVYVSSLANENLTSALTTDFLPGNLDRILGTLNLDLGDGRQVLMISDEAAIVGDGTAANPVRITDQPVAGLGLPPTEITITGLTPAPAITYKASPTGNIAGGITIWTGWGNDTISVDGTEQRGDGAIGSLRTVTTLNTGLGDDNVTVSLGNNDGFFVLNTQGPENNYVGLVSDRDTVDASASTRPLVIFGGQDDDSITGGQANDIIFGDRGLVSYYNGANAVTVLGHGGPGDKTDGVERPLGVVTTTFSDVGGQDIVYGRAGRDIVFGGFGSDILDASASDVADDILVGDNGQAIFTNGIITEVDTIATNLGGNDTITAGKGANIAFGGVGNDTIFAGGDALPDILLGDNGTAKFDPATGRLLQIFTTAPADAGQDVLTTGDGDSVVFGGSFSDLITTGAGSDLIVGDNGSAVFDPATYRVISVTTTAPDQAIGTGRTVNGVVYDDVIDGGAGNNVIFGGSGGDLITTQGGDDTIVGDNGNATFDPTGILRDIQTSDSNYAGNDRILAGIGGDIVLAGSGNDYVDSGSEALGDISRDVVVGDNGHAVFDAAGNLSSITTTVPATGGDDTLLIGGGNNVAFGGIGNDTITAGDGNDIIVGDNGSATFDAGTHVVVDVHTTDPLNAGLDIIDAANGNNIVLGGSANDTINTGTGADIIVGDNGVVLAYPSGIVRSVETTDPTSTGDDAITAGTGADIVFGGSGKDNIDSGSVAAGDVSRDVVVGDNGHADFDTAGNLALIYTTVPGTGGDDTILIGGGDNVAFGGFGNDTITAGDGNDIIVGDNGSATFHAATHTLANIHTTDPAIGGVDIITSGNGNNVVLGGADADTITSGTGDDIVLGDNGYVDYVVRDQNPSDIDVIASTDFDIGGIDTITTGAGADIVIGGAAGDIIDAGTGNNIVFGDSAQITAATADAPNFSTQPLTIGLMQTVAPGIGGADQITTGIGRDIIFGGTGGDTIIANFGETPTSLDGDNIVLGDDGLIDFTLAERTAAAPGADTSPADMDLIASTDFSDGGADQITTGNGSDIVIGGQANDTILVGNGTNVVIGDSGIITAATQDTNRFATQPMTVGRVETTAFGVGGIDTITSGSGNDLVLGGDAGDTIAAGDGDNVVIGDDGAIDYVRQERDGAVPGADLNAADIDLVTSLSMTAAGGVDRITTGVGNDIVIGGRFGDNIDAGTGSNIVLGDSGRIIAANADTARFGSAPTNLLTAGRIETLQPGDGGDDTINTGVGRDIILGGTGADTVTANNGETATLVDAENIIIGDDGYIDFVAAERTPTALGADTDATDIDVIASTDFADGGADIITTGNGSDIVIGGQANDRIAAGNGANIVIGDSGIITAATENTNHFATLPIAMGRIESTAFGVGGPDIITTGSGNDIVIGGHDADTIGAGEGDNIVLGDDGALDYTRQERNGVVPGADLSAADIDLITSLSTNLAGGSDTITTGAGNDIVIGGRFGDTINAGAGNNIVIGDSGQITAANQDTNRFGTQVITVGLIETNTFGDGGADNITTLGGIDVILGGHDNDTINAGDGDNVVLGDDGSIDYVRLERSSATPGADLDASDIDLITSLSTNVAGGADSITTGSGNDIILGGRFGDTIVAGNGNNIVLGDSGRITAVDENTPRFGMQAITVGRIETLDDGDGGADTIRAGSGQDVLLGGAGSDRIDGGAGDDLITGDNAILDRTGRVGNFTSALYEPLTGTLIYDSNANLLTNGVPSNQPGAAPIWADLTLTLLDHSFADQANPTSNKFGNDYIAGGAGNDRIFGELGDDVIQGDGSIDIAVSAKRLADGTLQVSGSVEAATDGDDYIEGNGGNDLIFGGLGQDNIIGGSSDFFGLTTHDQRPDGSDLIFGGAGTDIGRNDAGDTTATGRARDADVIAGDNADIIRLVGTNGVAAGNYLGFAYDNYSTLKLIATGVRLLDYTPGGIDMKPTAVNDIGAADEIHGESGNDTIYGQLGNDVIFGDGQDDDIIGGTGADWISAGTGDDGVIGDDGRIFTSRNGAAEPLYGIAGVPTGGLNDEITTPGGMQDAVINVAGALKKTAIVEPFELTNSPTGVPRTPSNDIIFGGLGSDFLHGGVGDDAISGAEALPTYFAVPFNPGNILAFGVYRPGEFAAYDEYNPLAKIYVDPRTYTFTSASTPGAVEFILNFVATEQDGNDVIFGDLGNDWIVGGMGRDHLYGGYGDDLLNADDNQDTAGGLNNVPDGPDTNQEDIAYGGAGRDVLIANTGGDRLIDWAGEFNSYLVPFAPFGAATISRALEPQLATFLYNLSASDGADPTRALKTGDSPARNGEPGGELGMVRQQDPDWGAQTGAPADPQPGNIPGGSRDVLRSADFNKGTADGFSPDSGSWTVTNGRLEVAPNLVGGEAISVFYVDATLPQYYEMKATVDAVKPTGGYKANGYLVFDYQSATDFKYAGIDIATDKMVIGHRDATGWHVDASTNMQLKPDTDYNMLLAVNGVTATLVINNTNALSYAFGPRVIDGYSYNLNTGMVGVGGDNSRVQIDNVSVQVLPPSVTFQNSEDFSDGAANLLKGDQVGAWAVSGGRYIGTSGAAGFAASNFNLGIGANSYLQVDTTLGIGAAGGSAGVIFDYYDATNFKFAALVAGTNQVVIGHCIKNTWTIDASVTRTVTAGTDYALSIMLKGTTVSVMVNGQAALGYAFNAVVTDGQAGLFTRGGTSSFASYLVKTNEPKLAGMVVASTAISTDTGLTLASPLVAVTGSPSVALDTGSLSLLTVDDVGLVQSERFGSKSW